MQALVSPTLCTYRKPQNFVRICYSFFRHRHCKIYCQQFQNVHWMRQLSCLFKSILNGQFIEIFSNKKFHSHSAQASQFAEWKKLKLKKLSMRRSWLEKIYLKILRATFSWINLKNLCIINFLLLWNSSSFHFLLFYFAWMAVILLLAFFPLSVCLSRRCHRPLICSPSHCFGSLWIWWRRWNCYDGNNFMKIV